jgi:hypothetical protein
MEVTMARYLIALIVLIGLPLTAQQSVPAIQFDSDVTRFSRCILCCLMPANSETN